MHSIKDVGVGKLLLAEPFMQDGHFKRSVVLICDHHDEGTVGFMLNKPLRININTLINDFPKSAAAVYAGGPVQPDTIHYIHTVGDVLEGSQKIVNGVYWGGDFEQLKALIDSGYIGPLDIRFYLGYSGWGTGQLAEEITDTNSWLIHDADPNYIFHYDSKVDLWQKILQNKGQGFGVLSTMPDENRLN